MHFYGCVGLEHAQQFALGTPKLIVCHQTHEILITEFTYLFKRRTKQPTQGIIYKNLFGFHLQFICPKLNSQRKLKKTHSVIWAEGTLDKEVQD